VWSQNPSSVILIAAISFLILFCLNQSSIFMSVVEVCTATKALRISSRAFCSRLSGQVVLIFPACRQAGVSLQSGTVAGPIPTKVGIKIES